MPLETQCPKCGTKYCLADETRGKLVRCRECQSPFSVEVPPSAPVKEAVRPQSPPMVARRREVEPDAADQPRPKPARPRERDRKEEARPRKKKTPSTIPVWVFMAGGGVAVVMLLGILGLGYLLMRPQKTLEERLVEEQVKFGKEVNKAWEKSLREAGFEVGEEPQNLDQALQQLKVPAERRGAALWLSRAPVDAARQAEVAKALEPLLTDADTGSRPAAFLAMRTWATRESVPALARALDEEKLFVGLSDAQAAAVETLGKLKDPRGAASLARFLPEHFARDKAIAALTTLGPGAEPAVLKYFNHKDGGCRDRTRVLLRTYSTKTGAIILQCAEDLRQGDRDHRQTAAEWLATAQVDPEHRSTVSAALDPLPLDQDHLVSAAALAALKHWAMPGNVPTLARCLDTDPHPHSREVMALLGQLKDPRGAAALAKRLEKDDRRDAGNALIAFGPTARAHVLPYLNHSDDGIRAEASRILQTYGGVGSGAEIVLQQAIGDLTSPNATRRSQAARQLEGIRVDPGRRAEVAAALGAVAADSSDRGAQESAIRALGSWGTRDNTQGLVRLLDDPQPSIRHAVMATLGKLKDERSVKGVAARLLDRVDRDTASRALLAMGPELGTTIESEVRSGLTNADKDFVRECLKILGAVGTRASVPALNQLAATATRAKQRDIIDAVQQTLASINARGR